jgi:hypothetical protein
MENVDSTQTNIASLTLGFHVSKIIFIKFLRVLRKHKEIPDT